MRTRARPFRGAKVKGDYASMAANLPAPRPGLRFTIRPIEVFLEWHKLHGFEITGWRGDELMIRVNKNGGSDG